MEKSDIPFYDDYETKEYRKNKSWWKEHIERTFIVNEDVCTIEEDDNEEDWLINE